MVKMIPEERVSDFAAEQIANVWSLQYCKSAVDVIHTIPKKLKFARVIQEGEHGPKGIIGRCLRCPPRFDWWRC